MRTIRAVCTMLLISIGIQACHHDKQYHDTQNRFAYDPNYRIGKWYSITDSGTTSQIHNTNLDTIWFINDSLAGWTGFVPYQPHKYVFWKTYLDPQSIYNIIYLAPGNPDTTKTDTVSHQFGFHGDTMVIVWDDWRQPPLTESYLKKKN